MTPGLTPLILFFLSEYRKVSRFAAVPDLNWAQVVAVGVICATTVGAAPKTVSGASGALVSVLVAWPVSVNDPASRSAWVIECVPVHTIEAPGARLAAGIDGTQLKPSSAGVSETLTLCSVVLPLFVAVSV